MKLIFDGPLNSLSFGNVSFNILKELFLAGHDVGLFLSNKDVSAYQVGNNFKEWLERGIERRWEFLNSDVPVLKLWHLNGSEKALSNNQTLLTFYECSEPTPAEVAIAKRQKNCVFSSSYAANLFEEKGATNVSSIHVGFDDSFSPSKKRYLPDDVIHFGLMGKFEKRKHTEAIIKTWLSKYGNNRKYLLSCCVTNPFFNAEQMRAILQNCLGGKSYSNINFLPYLPSNKEVNEFMNSVDIDLTGLSLSEGWNLPAFNMTCMGKWSIVGNHTAHTDWATSHNAIIVEPNGKTPCYDGVFFNKGGDFNQGDFFSYEEGAIEAALEIACHKAKTENPHGKKLAHDMSYKKMVSKIVEIL